MIQFAEAQTPVSLLLINNNENLNNQKSFGSAHVRVGNEGRIIPYSTTNTVVKTDIIEGGLFTLAPETG